MRIDQAEHYSSARSKVRAQGSPTSSHSVVDTDSEQQPLSRLVKCSNARNAPMDVLHRSHCSPLDNVRQLGYSAVSISSLISTTHTRPSIPRTWRAPRYSGNDSTSQCHPQILGYGAPDFLAMWHQLWSGLALPLPQDLKCTGRSPLRTELRLIAGLARRSARVYFLGTSCGGLRRVR